MRFLLFNLFVFSGLCASPWYNNMNDGARIRIDQGSEYMFFLGLPILNVGWKFGFDFILSKIVSKGSKLGTNCHFGPAFYPNIHYSVFPWLNIRTGFCFSIFDWANKNFFQENQRGFEYFTGGISNFNKDSTSAVLGSFFISSNVWVGQLHSSLRKTLLRKVGLGFDFRPSQYDNDRFLRAVIFLGCNNFSFKIDVWHGGGWFN